MVVNDPRWQLKHDKGLYRYLLFDGIVVLGGPFAVAMQIAGYFAFADEGQTFPQYMTSPATWVRFILHGLLFGLTVGYINWRRKEAAFTAAGNG